MEHLDEEQLREMIKEEVVRKIAANALDEQIFDKIMSFFKKNGSSAVEQEKISSAIEDHVEEIDDANIDQFVQKINDDIKALIDKNLQLFIYNVIEQAVTDNYNKMKGVNQ